MSTHLSEEEQVEALKNWWKDNGKSLIVGAVIGLAGVFGWHSWTQHRTTQAELASVRFENLHQAAHTGQDIAAVEKQAEILAGEHHDSIYADFAMLDLAKAKLQKDDPAGAAKALQWVLDNGRDDALKPLVQLRLARLKVSQGDTAAADGLLGQITGDAFKGEVLALRGDIARAKGDTQAARAAYADAIAANAGNRSLLRMKLDELGGDPDAANPS